MAKVFKKFRRKKSLEEVLKVAVGTVVGEEAEGSFGNGEVNQPRLLEMFMGVANLVAKDVENIMVPSSEMVILDTKMSQAELRAVIAKKNHSRYPVFNKEADEFQGFVLAKQLLHLVIDSRDVEAEISLVDILRRPLVVPESKLVSSILTEFIESKTHLALVKDEFGNISGMVTIENVLEEIIGDFSESHAEDNAKKIDNLKGNAISVSGRYSLFDLNKQLGSHFPEDAVETVAGFILEQLGRFPRKGEVLNEGSYTFKILECSARRIDRVEITLIS